MATTYYMQVHIESMGTTYTGDGISPTSLAGHIWYEVYQKDSNGNVIPSSQLNAGYTGDGIVGNDKDAYTGESAYTSQSLALSQDQYQKLKDFGLDTNGLATQNGFGPNDYNVFNNSCIDFTWKALELAGFNPSGFEGSLVPVWNRLALEAFLFHNYAYNADNDTTRPIDPNVTNLYTSAKNWSPPRADPLVLDLDGDGIETTGVGAGSVLFDHDGDGIKTATGWVKADDGLLVMDRNGNGTIDNGSELFGDQTLVNSTKAANGFAALTAEDTNHNGKFDAGDTNFTKVRIWQDKNQDGISQSTELITMQQAGIASINLTYTVSNIAYEGNLQLLRSTYIKTDGTSKQVGNYLFTNNAFYSEFTDHLTLTDTAKTLPDMQGSGMVRDMQEASTLSSSMTATLQNMQKNYMTHDAMMSQIDTLLVQWANTSIMLSDRQRAKVMGGDVVFMADYLSQYKLYHKYLWAQQHNNYSILTSDELIAAQNIVTQQNKLGTMIDVLERFNANGFSPTIDMFEGFYKQGTKVQINTLRGLEGYPTTSAWTFTSPMEISMSKAQATLIEQSYNALKESIYDALVLQTRLNNYLDTLDLMIDESGIHIDDTDMMNKLMILLSTDPKNAFLDMMELKQYAGVNLDVLGWNAGADINKMLEAVDGKYDATTLLASNGVIVVDGAFTGTMKDEYIVGKQRNDTINAGDGNNKIFSGSGNDSITSGKGEDILDGGAGADKMIGGMGNDTYIVDNIGDIVTETSTIATEIDTVQSSITYILGANIENLTLTGTANINGTGNSLNNILIGNGGANTLNGGLGADTMIGGAGNDTYIIDNAGDKVVENINEGIDSVNTSISYTLNANVENLVLTGTATINGTGNTLNNILTGNSANNVLTGGAGSDIFVFNTTLNASTNKDTISDFVALDDKIQLENGIFTKLTATGMLSAANFVASPSGVAIDANDYILYNTTTGTLSYDADGSGTGVAIQFATLTAHPIISNQNFSVI
ncbi:MAG: calcium-binding protein [Sulfuricurvum sp.]|nr:calcium-binding protein [Sulfuricurvum sp.]